MLLDPPCALGMMPTLVHPLQLCAHTGALRGSRRPTRPDRALGKDTIFELQSLVKLGTTIPPGRQVAHATQGTRFPYFWLPNF